MPAMHSKYGWVRGLRRRKRRARMWEAIVEKVVNKAKQEQQTVTIENIRLTSGELRCSNCGRKLAEPNRHGIIAGRIKCKACKQTTEVL